MWLLWRAWLASARRHPAWRGVLLGAMLLSALLLVGALLGRLHWLAALPAAALPLAHRAARLVGLLGMLRQWWPGSPGGRTSGENGAQGTGGRDRRRDPTELDLDEALEVLGLSGSPRRDEILAAHRRLMQRLHPDRGGTDWLAARVNAARDRLLRAAEARQASGDSGT